MKIQVEEGIPNWLLVTIVLSCASPAITLNVWPRIEQMVSQGFSSNAFGVVLLVTLSAVGMTCVPFAMKKADNWGFWSICLIFGIGLGILNYTMAVGAVGKTRDDESQSKAAIIQKANSLRQSLSEAEASRRSLPPFRWTTQEMVQTASQAVSLALSAKEQECKILGDICRARVIQLANRQGELADVSGNRAATERAEQIDSSIKSLRGAVNDLGPVPETVDPQATRIALVLGALLNLGPNAADKVATGLIHFLAICAEAFALGMPRIIVTALAKPTRVPFFLEKKNEPTPSPQTPPPIPASSKPRAKSPLPSKAPEAPIIQWKESFLIRSAGKLRTWDAYTSYRSWANLSNLTPSPFPFFEEELQKLGVRKENDPNSQRDYYLDVVIKQPLKAVS